jgi:cytochrome oxidase Cu insertion factor (SCO1/SenC/PrrC family)
LLSWCLRPHLAGASNEQRRFPVELRASASSVLVAFAISMCVYGVVDGGVAVASSTENSVYVAINGPAVHGGGAAPVFTLRNQRGALVTVGKTARTTTVLTFLDPRCWTDCPLLAAQLRQLDLRLGQPASLRIVAVAADPYHESPADVQHFITKHHLEGLRNFSFVTGSLSETRAVWSAYGIQVSMKPSDAMSIHSDDVFIISRRGSLEWLIPDDPANQWSAQASAESQINSLLAKVSPGL